MSDKELIARLNNLYSMLEEEGKYTKANTASFAKERIEALTKERDEAKALQSCGCSYDTPTDVCLGHHRLFERLHAVQRGKLEAKLVTCEKYRDAYAEMGRIGTQAVRDLEDKLAGCEARLGKAVEALRSTLNCIENTEGEMGVILGCGDKARATLAEIKLQSSEFATQKGESHE